jgi:dienelactone hydrolase
MRRMSPHPSRATPAKSAPLPDPSRRCGLLALLLATAAGCFNWNQVPTGVEQHALDLQVAGLTQLYTVLQPRPAAAQAAARHPAVILLHSGFSGDESESAKLARKLAQRGMVVILPSYRGERRKVDGKRSEGKIEFCRGEVDDAQAALHWLRAQPFVDSQRLAALGSSHGGCIALRLGEREPALRAVVTFSAPVAAAPLVEHLQSHPAQTFLYNGILASQLRSYIQTTPQEHPEQYAERSPLAAMGTLRMPLLIFHGTKDQIVPREQACWLYQALASSGRHVDESWISPQGQVYRPPASGCPQAAATPQAGDSLPVPTKFVFLEGQSHFYARRPKEAARAMALDFLQKELRAQAAEK